jgi:hypothetical protein
MPEAGEGLQGKELPALEAGCHHGAKFGWRDVRMVRCPDGAMSGACFRAGTEPRLLKSSLAKRPAMGYMLAIQA